LIVSDAGEPRQLDVAAATSMRNGPFLPGVPLWDSSTRPPKASSVIVVGGVDENSAPRISPRVLNQSFLWPYSRRLP